MTLPIQGLGLDFGRVIGNFNHDKAVQELARHTGKSAEKVREVIFDSGLSAHHESGDITSHQFFQEILSGLGDPPLDQRTFNEVWSDIFSPNPGLENILAQLRPELRRAVLSNTDPLHWKRIEQLPVMRSFFHDPSILALSFRVGARKPAQRMYVSMLERLGTEPYQTLYIDDIPNYVEAFRRMGGNAEQYDCTKQPLSDLHEILVRYGCI